MKKINGWKNYFRSSALRDGYNLFRNGNVTNFREINEDQVIAEVRENSLRRRVVMQTVGERLLGTCTCYEGGRGYFCKHMAAVLYHHEENGASVDVLFDPKTHERFYFNLAQITKDIRISRQDINGAKQLISDHKIRMDSFQVHYVSDYKSTRLMAFIRGSVFGYRNAADQMEIRMTKDSIEMAYCNGCGRNYYGFYYSDRRLCAHLVALLMKADEYIALYNPGDETTLSGARLLNSFAGMQAIRKMDEGTKKAAHVILEPRLTAVRDILQLSFKIGVGKMYVLKNMQNLKETHDSFGVMTLGKGNEIRFADETFTPESEKYYGFIVDQLREEEVFKQRVYRQFGDLPSREIRSYIELRGQVLDDFYDMCLGRSVEFTDKTETVSARALYIGEASFRLHLTVQKQESSGRFVGVEISGEMPLYYEGTRSLYYIQGSTLARMSDSDRQFITPFLEASSEGEIRMTIGLQHLSEFYYRVLPALREHPLIDIEEDESVNTYLPPEAQFDMYLDIENELVTCQGTVSYENQKLDLKEITEADLPLESWRDIHQEVKALETVQRHFENYDSVKKLFWSGKDDESIYDLLNSGIRELMEIGNVHGSDTFNRLRIRRTPVVNVGVSLSNNLLDLQITTQQMSPEELIEVLESYRKKKRFHRLRSGEFIAFEQNESLDMLTVMMESMGISLDEFVSGKLHLPAYRALYLNKMLEEHDSIAADRDRNFRNLIRNFNAVKDSEYDVPEGLKPVLRNYQIYGYKWLRTLADLGFGGILADDMGLGKTIQMIACILGRVQSGVNKPSLIICPASVVYNWAEEFTRFAPELRVTPLAGGISARSRLMNSDTDVFITSYDLLKRDIGRYKDLSFDCQVLDEGQFIKNPKAAVSKAVKIIDAEHRFVLTGTPIENRLSELWSIFDYLMPGFLYTYDRFRTGFETPIAKNKDEVTAAQLRKMVSPFILRRLKQDVLKDLPDKMEEVRYARFDDVQQKVYDGQVAHMKQMIETSDDDNKIRILAELTRIRQICCDPSLILDDYQGESAKKDACMQLIESAMDGGHKMLVFSQFTSMLDILKKELDERNISYYVITGATSKEERMRLVHRFNENDVPVFLISLKAGGTGLNLTGADVVIHYDPWWNLAVQNQATDRAHRIGQKSTVTVYRLIAKDTIEEKILELQEAKKDLSDAILSGETTSLGQLSREELLELLS